MSKSYSLGREGRLYHVLVRWFEEQLRSGRLREGDRLPPERKLGEQFGISRTAVREALRALSARGLIESHVGRGTFVRASGPVGGWELPHGSNGEASEALLHVMASLAHLAAERHTEPDLEKLHAHAAEGVQAPAAFLHALGEAASNPLLGTLAGTLACLDRHQAGGVLHRLDMRHIVSCIAAREPERARHAVLRGCSDTA